MYRQHHRSEGVAADAALFLVLLAKSALWTATRTMAQSFAPNIRVNAVGPGPVFPSQNYGEKGFEIEARGVPLHRPADVAGIVDTVIYLSHAQRYGADDRSRQRAASRLGDARRAAGKSGRKGVANSEWRIENSK